MAPATGWRLENEAFRLAQIRRNRTNGLAGLSQIARCFVGNVLFCRMFFHCRAWRMSQIRTNRMGGPSLKLLNLLDRKGIAALI